MSAKDFVPLASLDGRPKPREREADFSRKRLAPVGKAIARSVSVGGATKKTRQEACNIDE
jgi:hypothetical protein